MIEQVYIVFIYLEALIQKSDYLVYIVYKLVTLY